jgi:ferritin
MLNPDITKALNAQVTAEFYSSSLYLSMSAWCQGQSLPGIAHWMKLQADEERVHGLKLFNFVLARGSQAILEAIPAPPMAFDSPESLMKQVAAHEAHVSVLINGLYGLARDEKDYATESFLLWFVSEQVEEEAQAHLLYAQLKMIGASKSGLLRLDYELSKRPATAS